MSDNLFQASIETFGVDAQWRQLQEECGELIAAVNQVIFRGRDPVDKILEELASVELMINQVKYLLKCPIACNTFMELEKEKSWDAIRKQKEKVEKLIAESKAAADSSE
jgi:NTP pyrophosphatase (non-canonical NTP hydrolase)